MHDTFTRGKLRARAKALGLGKRTRAQVIKAIRQYRTVRS